MHLKSLKLYIAEKAAAKKASAQRTPYQRRGEQLEEKIMFPVTKEIRASVSILKYIGMLTPELMEQAATLGLNKPQVLAMLRDNNCTLEETLNEELMEELMESYIQTNNL